MSDTVTTGTTGSTTAEVRDRASEVAGTAKQQAKVVASDAKDQARQLLDNSRQQMREQAGQQTQKAASSLRDLGDQLQRMVAGEGPAEGPAADITRQAAQSVQRLADSLEHRRPEQLLDDVKRFARERPGVFVLGALGAGFLAGRVLRNVDTSSIADAAKAGAGTGQSDGQRDGQGQELVNGPGSLAALAAPTSVDPAASDAIATGMVGTTPADLVDPQPGAGIS